jgi:hypothetical protein
MTEELNPIDPSLQALITEARRPVTMDAGARVRLMEAIRAETPPRAAVPFVGWLLEPRRLTLPPLATLAAAAGLVGIGVLSGLVYNRDGRAPATEHPRDVAASPQLPDSVAPRVIKFVLVAPQASRVSLVGDFNRWDAAAAPAAKQSDGSWAIFVPLTPGRHVYSFVVDGMHFVPDPSAPVAPDDGYGQKNSVVVVKGATS